MVELTPCDTGARLEPHPWVRDGNAAPGGLPRRAVADDYGRVDFDSDDGTTILTLHIEQAPDGYRMRIDQHSDDHLRVLGANEPPALVGPAAELDVEYHRAQMLLLDRELKKVGTACPEHVHYVDDGDPLTFSPGHFVFHQDGGAGWFAIEELYARGTDWADEDLVPIGWAWHEHGPVTFPTARCRTRAVAEGTVIPSAAALATRAWVWAAVIDATAPPAEPHSPGREGPDRPAPSRRPAAPRTWPATIDPFSLLEGP